jgi:carbamoyl-phosphate synthase large subunit
MVTSVGGDLAQNVISCIKKIRGDTWLLGTDINPKNSGQSFVDQFIASELVSDPDYLEWLEGVLDEFEIEAFVPMSEAEIRYFAGIDELYFNSVFKKVKFVGADRKIVNVFTDKLETQRWLNSAGFNSPKIYSKIDSNELVFPIIIKPRFGSGSKNVFKCTNLIELNSALNLVPEPIVQEYIGSDSDEFTLGLYSNGDQNKIIAFRRLLSSSGYTSWAKHEVNDKFLELGIAIADKLKLEGSINIQLRLHEGEPYIFEINPRFSSTVFIRSELGFNDVAWSLGDESTMGEFDNLFQSNAEFATYVKTVRII